MRQGESQIFRKFLQDWELQLEYAGGREWPDSIKINNLRNALSNKIRDKYAVLNLPSNNFKEWTNIITRVAAVMEDDEYFIRKGEAQTTQYASRSGALQSEYLAGPFSKQTSSSASNTVDNEGDTIMGGMKIDLHSLATLLAQINVQKEQSKKGGFPSKPPAPWLTEQEVAELRKKNLCLRCKKSGHISRFCNKFGPPKRSPQISNLQNVCNFNDDLDSSLGKD